MEFHAFDDLNHRLFRFHLRRRYVLEARFKSEAIISFRLRMFSTTGKIKVASHPACRELLHIDSLENFHFAICLLVTIGLTLRSNCNTN